MQLEISRTNYETLMTLIDKAAAIIKQNNPSNREYNVARRLLQTKRNIIRQIEKRNGRQV